MSSEKQMRSSETRILLTGFFSTVGDLEVLDCTEAFLSEIGVDFERGAIHRDVSIALEIPHISQINPEEFSHVMIVCGPVWPDFFLIHDLSKFKHCIFGGINLSLIGFANLSETPFSYLRARDWHDEVRIDLSFYARTPTKPLVGLILAPPQEEYGSNQLNSKVVEIIEQMRKLGKYSVLELDTRWPVTRNFNKLRSPEEFESVLAKVDVVLTSRLHGMVLGRKLSIPTIPIDPIAGGGKVSAQAQVLGVKCLHVDNLSVENVIVALDACLSDTKPVRVADTLAMPGDEKDEIMEGLRSFASETEKTASDFFERMAGSHAGGDVRRKMTAKRAVSGTLRRAANLLDRAAQRLS